MSFVQNKGNGSPLWRCESLDADGQSSGPIVCLLIHSFIRSFIIQCLCSEHLPRMPQALCSVQVKEKRTRQAKPLTSWSSQALSVPCPLSASPQRTGQAIAALRATPVAQSSKGPKGAPESTWQASPGCRPGAAGQGVGGGRAGIGVAVPLSSHILGVELLFLSW